ncbi:MAG: Epoxyqueuosine reductase [Syntrophus sp. SKADARSKE-3]|nr:Epoxyqueuosine reductase [Syntrophus sp. SKADARSKE-3]
MDKEEIRGYGRDIGIDVVGFTALEDYRSERSPDPREILPKAASIIVFGHRMIDGALDSNNPRLNMVGRMGVMDTSKNHLYLMARFIEKKYRAKATPVLSSYPLDMSVPALGLLGDVSLRHAAVSAGLGCFGRHNLVIHPVYGSRLSFTGLLTELPLSSDPAVAENPCNDCGLCVEACPGKALDVEGKTEDLKCLRASQPFGIGTAVGYIRSFFGKTPDEQKALLKDPLFMSLYQASFIGFQYACFRCIAVCPMGDICS